MSDYFFLIVQKLVRNTCYHLILFRKAQHSMFDQKEFLPLIGTSDCARKSNC